MNIDILAFGAHPDDVECAAGGVVLKTTTSGGRVVIVDLTKGELGTFGDQFSRKEESIIASKILGIADRVQLDLKDGNIENNQENRLEIIRVIRKYRPKIILANAINDRHPDHKKASELVSQASFLSGLQKIESKDGKHAQEAWRAKVIYHYIQDYYIEPNLVVDISSYYEQKLLAIKAYGTQFASANDYQANGTLALLKQIESINHIFGRAINVQYAEGFTTERYVGVKNILDLV